MALDNGFFRSEFNFKQVYIDGVICRMRNHYEGREAVGLKGMRNFQDLDEKESNVRRT